MQELFILWNSLEFFGIFWENLGVFREIWELRLLFLMICGIV